MASARGWKRWMFALAPVTILLVGGEAAARVWLHRFADREAQARFGLPSEFPEACRFAPHPYSCYRLNPGKQRDGAWHDERGFRGPAVARPKPPGRFRIAVLGGSTTYCEFIRDDARTFPSVLGRTLRDEFGYANVDVLNAGVPGYNSWESLVDLEFRVLDDRPDLVIPYFGVNDVHTRLVEPTAYRGDNTGRRRAWSPPWEVRVLECSCLLRVLGGNLGVWKPPGVENYTLADTAYHRTRDAGPEMERVLSANTIGPFRRNLRLAHAVAKSHGAGVVFVTWPFSHEIGDYVTLPHYRRGVAQLNQAVRETAAELDAPLFDLAEAMPKDPDYWRDGRHVNESGAAVQGEALAEFLVKNRLLDRRPSPSAN